MNVDAESFWRRLDEGLLNKGVSLRKMCQDTHYTYKGVINQRSAKIVPPKINQLVDFSSYLDMPLGYLILGKKSSALPLTPEGMEDIVDALGHATLDERNLVRRIFGLRERGRPSSSKEDEA